jgi:hypothetical protein
MPAMGSVFNSDFGDVGTVSTKLACQKTTATTTPFNVSINGNNYRIFNSSDIDFNVFFILSFCVIIFSLIFIEKVINLPLKYILYRRNCIGI